MLESVTSIRRGTKTERKLVLMLLKRGINAKAIFHDLYLKTHNNHFSQIDLVVATRVGIIVFEVKEYSGWIFANGNHKNWTQIMSYGKSKYYFYNPIKQNERHIEVLKKQSKQFDNIPFYSVLVFFGNCEFKSLDSVPEGTIVITANRLDEALSHILDNQVNASYTDKFEIIDLLKNAVINGENKQIRLQHIENIRRMGL